MVGGTSPPPKIKGLPRLVSEEAPFFCSGKRELIAKFRALQLWCKVVFYLIYVGAYYCKKRI